MRIIARVPINDFGSKHYPAIVPLNDWWEKTKKASPANLNELKEVFGSCDYIGDDRYVFNIGGNKYRIVAIISFKKQKVWIRGVLTHAEYDELNKRGTLIKL